MELPFLSYFLSLVAYTKPSARNSKRESIIPVECRYIKEQHQLVQYALLKSHMQTNGHLESISKCGES